MARKRDTAAAIAGLAALAALMRRGDAESVPVEDRSFRAAPRDVPAPAPAQPSATGYRTLYGPGYEGDEVRNTRGMDVVDESGMVNPRLRRNPETGELYSTEVTTSPRAATRAAPAAVQRPAPQAGGQGIDAATARRLDSLAALRKFEQQQEDAYQRARQQRLATPGADAIEQDIDVLNPIPIPGLGRLRSAAQALSKSRALAVRKAEETPLTYLGRSGERNVTPPRQIGTAERKLLEGPVRKEGVPPPPKRELLPYDRRRSTAEAMEEAKPILQARPGKPSPRSATRYDEDMTGVEFKKGGKTKKMAKGGVSRPSASSRGDGIAKRGKTRGRMY